MKNEQVLELLVLVRMQWGLVLILNL
jgi:hypothetical protein